VRAGKPEGKKKLAGIIAVIREKVGGKKSPLENITVLSEGLIQSEVTAWLPTGFSNVDTILGGGWPVGRMSEVSGPEGSGKSALSHMAVRQCLDGGGLVLMLESESSFDERVVTQLGIDADRCAVAYPRDTEEAWDIMYHFGKQLVASPVLGPSLVVWDSVAASVTRSEQKAETVADQEVAGLARVMGRGIRRQNNLAPKMRAALLFINQVRVKFGGSSFGTEYETPGGRMLKHWATVRVRTGRRRTLKKGALPSGFEIITRTIKHKLYPPGQKANFVIDFVRGPNAEATAFHLLVAARKIKTSGSGHYQCPWSGDKFKNPMTTDDATWYDLLADAAVRKDVMAALALCVNVDDKK